MKHLSTRNVALVLIGLSSLVGCGGEADPTSKVTAANSTNLKRLANLYQAYQSEHNWAGPKNEADFKDFIRTLNSNLLARINVDPAAVDSLFTSERDGQPYKIRFGVPGSLKGSSEPVIFESAGVDGKFEVGQLDMVQVEVDQAQRDALFAGKAPSASTQR